MMTYKFSWLMAFLVCLSLLAEDSLTDLTVERTGFSVDKTATIAYFSIKSSDRLIHEFDGAKSTLTFTDDKGNDLIEVGKTFREIIMELDVNSSQLKNRLNFENSLVYRRFGSNNIPRTMHLQFHAQTPPSSEAQNVFVKGIVRISLAGDKMYVLETTVGDIRRNSVQKKGLDINFMRISSGRGDGAGGVGSYRYIDYDMDTELIVKDVTVDKPNKYRYYSYSKLARTQNGIISLDTRFSDDAKVKITYFGKIEIDVPVDLSYGPTYAAADDGTTLEKGFPKIIEKSWTTKRLSAKQKDVIFKRIYNSMSRADNFYHKNYYHYLNHTIHLRASVKTTRWFQGFKKRQEMPDKSTKVGAYITIKFLGEEGVVDELIAELNSAK